MKTREPNDFDFDVAISFAGEDRGIAGQIAELLTKEGIRVFYDIDEQADLWGKDLYKHLAEIYFAKARFCLVLVSSHYSKKIWPRHEIQNAFARALQENREYILPLKLDDTAIPGIPPTIGHHDLRHSSIEETVDLIMTKLGKAGVERDDHQEKERRGATEKTSEIPLPPIKRQFSDRDRATFLKDAFESTVAYFKDGLKALKQHDPAIETEESEITKQKYVFEVYRDGEMKNSCKIWIGSLGSQRNISYREGDFAPHDDSSVNEWIHVESDDRQMYLIGLMGDFGNRLNNKLSVEDAARILWERFIHPLSC
ncbi:MAG: toll/interleukin-1 receptor domain-containing protein [Desulfomonilaceae bacterium]